MNIVATMPTMQKAIATVEAQPSQYSGPVTTSSPMTLGRRTRTIRSTMTGAASTPFTTALQYKAWIGSIGVKFKPMPQRPEKPSTE